MKFATYGALLLAILCEVTATTFLQKSEQFTRLAPSVITIIGYGGAFYFLSICLKVIPVGIAYAIWSGLGIVLISLVGYFLIGQKLDLAALIGLALIVAGVLVINLFSRSIPH